MPGSHYLLNVMKLRPCGQNPGLYNSFIVHTCTYPSFISGQDQHHLAVKTDVSKSGSVDALAAQISAAFGDRIPTGIVHCAGVIPNMRGIEHETEESFDKVFAVNVKGTFLINQKFTLMMRQKKSRGSIVNISSNGVHGFGFAPAYAATKGAISSFTKSLALG